MGQCHSHIVRRACDKRDDIIKSCGTYYWITIPGSELPIGGLNPSLGLHHISASPLHSLVFLSFQVWTLRSPNKLFHYHLLCPVCLPGSLTFSNPGSLLFFLDVGNDTFCSCLYCVPTPSLLICWRTFHMSSLKLSYSSRLCLQCSGFHGHLDILYLGHLFQSLFLPQSFKLWKLCSIDFITLYCSDVLSHL